MKNKKILPQEKKIDYPEKLKDKVEVLSRLISINEQLESEKKEKPSASNLKNQKSSKDKPNKLVLLMHRGKENPDKKVMVLEEVNQKDEESTDQVKATATVPETAGKMMEEKTKRKGG